VTLVTDRNVTEFDYLDPGLRGPRFHERMRELHSAGWLAQWPLGYFVLDREAVEFFLCKRAGQLHVVEVHPVDVADQGRGEQDRRPR